MSIQAYLEAGIPHIRAGLVRYGMRMGWGRMAINTRMNWADKAPFPPNPLLWGIVDHLP